MCDMAIRLFFREVVSTTGTIMTRTDQHKAVVAMGNVHPISTQDMEAADHLAMDPAMALLRLRRVLWMLKFRYEGDTHFPSLFSTVLWEVRRTFHSFSSCSVFRLLFARSIKRFSCLISPASLVPNSEMREDFWRPVSFSWRRCIYSYLRVPGFLCLSLDVRNLGYFSYISEADKLDNSIDPEWLEVDIPKPIKIVKKVLIPTFRHTRVGAAIA